MHKVFTISASNSGRICKSCSFPATQFYQHAAGCVRLYVSQCEPANGKILPLARCVDDISNLSLCRHTVIYDFSHAGKRALGVSLLHLKPITVKWGDYCIIHAWKKAAG